MTRRSSFSAVRLRAIWFSAAGVVATIYAVITPPFQAPDEVGHYWRAEAAARGQLQPPMSKGAPVATIPRSSRDLVAALWVDTAGKSPPATTVGMDRIRAARGIVFRRGDVVEVPAVAYATPIPYAPQAIALAVANAAGVRPLGSFYIGRLVNAWTALLLIYVASSGAPIVIAVASLPMTLYLLGSYSGDALTIALAMFVMAMAVRATDRWIMFVAAAIALALTKTVYFALPLLRPATMRRTLLLLIAVVAAAGLAAHVATTHAFAMRAGVPTNPDLQMQYVRSHPLTFAAVMTRDYASNAIRYARELVGQLGWLDIPLPRLLVNAALLLLAAIAMTAPRDLPMWMRAAAVLIFFATCALISLSQYVVWTAVGADRIDGIQGRYFLPVAPVALIAIRGAFANPRVQWLAAAAFAIAIVALHAFAIARIVQRYY